MTDSLQVRIPDEAYRLVDFRKDDLPGIAVVNSGLVGFEPRDIFAWHLSIILEFEELVDNGMPSQEEREVADAFGDEIDAILKGSPDKPNALFLARVTWNGTRQLVYRVHDPEIANDTLQSMIHSQSNPREFDFRMEGDPEWEFAQWHFQAGTH